MRQTLPNVVWLRDSQQKKALNVAAWRSEPVVDGLSFYAPSFYRFESSAPWLCGTVIDFPEPLALPLPSVVRRETPDPDRFTAIHAEILKGIAEGRFQKVVPFASEELEFAAPLHWSMWPAALGDPGPQFAFGFQFQGEGMCGVTPELLFRVKDGVLSTMALAGTGSLNGPPLLNDAKEKLEHQLVIDHLVESLSSLGPVMVGATVECVYPHLRHLRTSVTVRLADPPQFLDLIQRLHPTAALGGLPRSAALDFLRLRGGERGRFGAPFGWVNGDEMMCVVAIRGVQWQGAHARLLSGCGVVEGSVAAREWQELELKRSSTARQLGVLRS